MNLQAALINHGTTRMPSKEGVNSTLVSNRVPVGPTIYGEILVGEHFRIDDANFEHAEFRIFLYTRFI